MGSSGLKTISYCMQASAKGTGQSLIRKEIDRAVAAYSATQGGSADTSGGETLADNITDLEFRYYDGTDWQTDWDSDDQQRLPTAVEITISLPANQTPNNNSGTLLAMNTPGSGSPDLDEQISYRMVVQLPASTPPPDASSTGSDTSSTDTSSQPDLPNTGRTSGSSSSGTGTQTGEGSGSRPTGGKGGPGGKGGGKGGPGGPGGVAPPGTGAPIPGAPGAAVPAPPGASGAKPGTPSTPSVPSVPPIPKK